MKKSKIIPLILTLGVWFLMFYIILPPINIHSRDFWAFVIMMLLIAVVLNMWTIVKPFLLEKGSMKNRESFKRLKFIIVVFGAISIFYVGGNILSSPIIRASAYRELITVQSSNFSDDIKEVDYTQIPILDKDSAAKLSERKMGSMVDMVSQYVVSNYYSQINYQNKPVRVTPLEYSDTIKWFLNKKTGIPAYIRIDMTTQDVELVKLDEGIKYSPSDLFGRDINRYLRFRYPTAIFRSVNFEIDDEGTPFWICPVVTHKIGLFGGVDIKGAVIVNAITGEHSYNDISDIPQWIDKVYEAELLVEQYDYYGKFVNGFINSIFGQKGCLQTTEGYNYLALDDDVWIYTGITSVTGDESIVGFVLINQRTKETKYYQISGAKEISAMSSAEGQVQHLGYRSTFPLLLNVGGEPTYFLALKDSAGLVKKYALVNIEKYQIVAIGDSVKECEKNYKSLMASNGIDTVNILDYKEITGTITDVKNIIIDGNTYYYISLDTSDDFFGVIVRDNIEVLNKEVGDKVEMTYIETESQGINTVVKIDEMDMKTIDQSVEIPGDLDLESEFDTITE